MKPKPWTTKKADGIFSLWVRSRDRGCFFKCGNPATQNSHYWGRQISATRYDPENCDGICGGCHMRHESNKQGEYRNRKIAQLGMARYKALERRARSTYPRAKAIADFREWYEAEQLPQER